MYKTTFTVYIKKIKCFKAVTEKQKALKFAPDFNTSVSLYYIITSLYFFELKKTLQPTATNKQNGNNRLNINTN